MAMPDYIAKLLDRIAKLERRIDELQTTVKRDRENAIKTGEMITDYLWEDEAHMNDVTERLEAIERFLFPHLTKDMKNLGKIIGKGVGAPKGPSLDRKRK